VRGRIHDLPSRVGGICSQGTAREQLHGFRQQRVLERAQRRQHLRRIARVGESDRALEDHGSGVHARVDEMHGHPEHLHAVVERLLDRANPGERGQQGRVHVDHRAGIAGEKALAELSEKGSIPMDFTQPGGIALAAVELPKGSYPGTDLKSAVFNINVNRSLSASECEQFGTSELVRPQVAPPAKVLIGDAEFSQVEDISSEKNSETRYYHMFKNGACYEVALGLGVSEIVSESEVTPVNRQDIFSKLEKILWTVKVKATDDHEVAATVTVSGSGERQ